MQLTAEQITRTPLQAPDGEIGRCKDLMFDEDSWVVRYLVADTHKWFPFGQKVVISPIAVDAEHWNPEESIPVRMSKEEIKNAPPLSSHLPVSREYEIKMFRYYGYGYYWMGAGLWGTYPHPSPLINTPPGDEDVDFDKDRSTGLRSMSEIDGYTVKATDGTLGHVSDFILDDKSWLISRLKVSTRDILPGGEEYLIPVEWVREIDWLQKVVFISKSLADAK